MMYDAFVSYSRKDDRDGSIRQFAEQLRADFEALESRPMRLFFDAAEIRGMDDWRDRILGGLRQSRLLLTCLSPSYFDSPYCEWEFNEFRKHEVARAIVGEGIAPIHFGELPDWIEMGGEQGLAEWITELRRRQRFDLRGRLGRDTVRDDHANGQWQTLIRQLAERIQRSQRAEESLGNVAAHNPHFVGRMTEIRRLRETIGLGRDGVLTIVHGLGGIGKTALAVEYAHAYAHEYAGRWQVSCEGHDDLRSAIASLAPAMRIEFRDAERVDLDAQFQRVLAELRHLADTREPQRCLLILDNVDAPELLDPEQTQRFPAADWLHVVATTQLGPGDLVGERDDRAFVAVDELLPNDARDLIESFQPNGRFANAGEGTAVEQLVKLLGQFTLAVENAAVYLGRYPDVTCADFAERLIADGLTGLEQVAAGQDQRIRHREASLALTLQPMLDRLSDAEVLALRYASVLPADCIAWEWLETLIGDEFSEFALAVSPGHADPWAVLRSRLESLRLVISTGQPGIARMHRLLQEFVLSEFSGPRERLRNNLIEHALRACSIAESDWTDAETRRELVPLTAWAKQLIEQDPERGVTLQSTLGNLLCRLALYRDAEPLLRHALRVTERLFGFDHPNAASLANDLAILLFEMNKLAEAEPLMRRVITTFEKSSGEREPRFAAALNNLAQLLHATNRLAEAEPLMRRALAIDEQSFGPKHSTVARDLNNLASLLQATNRLAEAEPLMRRALAIAEQSFGAEHPNIATSLNNLAHLLKATNRLADAEPLMRRALAIHEQAFGAEHPQVAIGLSNLASLLLATNRLAEAVPLMCRALAIDERSLGAEHPVVATDLNNLASLLLATNRLAEAEPLMRRALAIDEQSFGPEHPNVAIHVNNLAWLLQATNRLAEAEPLMCRCVRVFHRFGQSTGHDHPRMKWMLANYGKLLETMGLSKAEIEERVREALS